MRRRLSPAGVHEGVLKSSGRMIVGSVSAEVYRRIEDYGRKAASAPDASKPDDAAATTKSASEQTKNPPQPAPSATDRADLASPPNPWAALRVGARVLAAYWNEKREFEGFWLANVKRIENGEFTLEWFDADYPAFKKAAKNVALLHPEFRVTGESPGRARPPQRSSFPLHGAACGSPLFIPRMPRTRRAPIQPPTIKRPSHDQHNRVPSRTHPRPQRRLPPHLCRRPGRDHRGR